MNKERKTTVPEQEHLKRIEKELLECEQRYRMLVEQSADSIVIHNLAGKILFINASGARMLGGKTPEDIIGKDAMQFVHSDSLDLVQSKIKDMLEDYTNKNVSRQRHTIEHKFIRLDGSGFYAETRPIPLVYTGELCIQVIIRDITERKQAEEALNTIKDNLERMIEERTAKLEMANALLIDEIEERKRIERQKELIQSQLLQAHKMEIVGRFASGIAHDFNNITTIIKTLSGLALKNISTGQPLDQLKEYLEVIDATTERGTNLTRQLLISTRNQPIAFKQINPGSIIESMAGTLRHILEENIVIKTVLAPDLWDILADKGNMDQVIMNLVLNAKDSMTLGGGIIHIKAENIILDEECTGIPVATPGSYVSIIVEDSGTGMDSTTVDNLFEPFFSTKESGKGLGLGLSVVSTIVEGHNGVIAVLSEPDKGSVFKVFLPAVPCSVPVEDKEDLLQGPDGHTERILIVEDENSLLKSVAMMLCKSNYRVFQAQNAEEAIDIFEKENGEIDLVFTDVLLSGNSGVQLVEELLIKKPGLTVIFTSGYLDIRAYWPFIQKGGYGFVQKPYEQQDMLQAINEALKR